jgi:CheY-like chemotaxis protein
MPKIRILIVDNDENTLITLKALLLAQEPFNIDTALSGKEALAKIADNFRYDIAIMDIMMPEMSGIDVCKVMNQDEALKKIPVLLMSSAVPLPPDEFHASLRKSDDLEVVKGVIDKPFNVSNILEKIYQTVKLYPIK